MKRTNHVVAARDGKAGASMAMNFLKAEGTETILSKGHSQDISIITLIFSQGQQGYGVRQRHGGGRGVENERVHCLTLPGCAANEGCRMLGKRGDAGGGRHPV
jgi:hypothetical protein